MVTFSLYHTLFLKRKEFIKKEKIKTRVYTSGKHLLALCSILIIFSQNPHICSFFIKRMLVNYYLKILVSLHIEIVVTETSSDFEEFRICVLLFFSFALFKQTRFIGTFYNVISIQNDLSLLRLHSKIKCQHFFTNSKHVMVSIIKYQLAQIHS